jgi:type I restriction enzyme, S subunit
MNKETIQHRLPEGWAKAKLGMVASFINGKSFKSEDWKTFGIPIIRIQNLNDNSANYNFIGEEQFIEEKYFVTKGDLLFAWSGTPGTSFGAHIWNGKNAYLNQHIYKVQTHGINKQFFYHLLNYLVHDFIKKSKGSAGLTHITKKTLENTVCFIPTLNEQNRIVDKIEELFSGLDKSETTLKNVKKQIEIQKYILLKNAFEGKLSEKWRKNKILFSAEKLLNRIQREKEKLRQRQQQEWENKVIVWIKNGKNSPKPEKPNFPKEVSPLTTKEINDLPKLPSTWKWAKLGDIGILLSGQHILEKDYNIKANGLPYLTGPSDFGDKLPIISKWTLVPKAIAKENDILITVKGSGVGKINLMNVEGAIGRQLMSFFSFYKEKMFLFFFIESRLKSFQNLSTGTAIPGIDRESILNLPCLVLDEKEQAFIVQELEFQYSIIKNLEKNINNGLKQSETLKHSILKKAFSGQLVFNDRANLEGNILLQQIQAEKQNYINEQKEIEKLKPKRNKMNEKKNLSVLEILKKAKEPISAKDLWQKSMHKDNIEDFYEELKQIKGQLLEIKNNTESMLTLQQ